MRKMIVSEVLSLDGVMQAREGPGRDEFEHGGWQMPYFDDAAGSAIADAMHATGGTSAPRAR